MVRWFRLRVSPEVTGSCGQTPLKASLHQRIYFRAHSDNRWPGAQFLTTWVPHSIAPGLPVEWAVINRQRSRCLPNFRTDIPLLLPYSTGHKSIPSAMSEEATRWCEYQEMKIIRKPLKGWLCLNNSTTLLNYAFNFSVRCWFSSA